MIEAGVALQPLPFYIVTLSHPNWEEAVACAARLPEEALPELRLDLQPEADPMELVRSLKGRCLVTCRKVSLRMCGVVASP